MKRLIVGLLLTTLLISGCTDAANAPSGSISAEVHMESKLDGLTVLDLKKKYGSENNKAIMPMYNVEQNKEFIFNFNTDLGSDLGVKDIISVHTDSKVLPESKILTFDRYETNDGKSTVSTKPVGWGVLASDALKSQSDSSWGGAPIYYIRLNYDLDAATPTKLEKPIVIPFTVKSDLPVPNVHHEISADGRFKLVWDKVEGAEGYKIYNRSKITLMETSNKAVTGAEEGYIGDLPLLEATTKDTEFNDFMNDGKGALGSTDQDLTSIQNMAVNGEYYVTAFKGNQESRFSVGVSTVPLSKQLPSQMEDGLSLTTFPTIADLPKTTQVKFIDGSTQDLDVIYDSSRIEIKQYSPTNVYFTIKGTALKGYVMVETVTPEDVKKLPGGEQAASTGFVPPKNDTDYVPKPDVPTIINPPAEPSSSPSASSSPDAPTDDMVEAQKENTKQKVEEGNKETVPVPDIAKEIKVNADSALEELLAANMVDAQDKISLKAFPESQNFEALADAMQKVIYQNPLILGVKGFQYDYKSLTLTVKYDDSSDSIKKKQQEIIAEAKKIVGSTIKDGMSDDAKRKALYQYLADNTKYDHEALKSAEANGFKEIDAKFNDSFTTYGIMVKKVGVCASYASVYKMLSDLSGLDSIVVTGVMGNVPHAWNKVKIGDEWLHVDVTNNEKNSGIPFILYNSNDETAASLDFAPDKSYWIDSELSKFDGQDNSKDYYVVNGLEVKSLSEYSSKLADHLKQGEALISLRLAGKFDEDELMEETANVFNKVAKDKLDTAKMSGLGTYIVIKP